MPDYYTYMMRHGECWVQALVERLEKDAGGEANIYLPLEQRWSLVMQRPELDGAFHLSVAA